MDGGQIAALMLRLADVQRDVRASHTPLRDEVQQLSTAVRHQHRILQTLTRGRGRSRDAGLSVWRSGLTSVPEQGERSSLASDANCTEAHPDAPQAAQPPHAPRCTVDDVTVALSALPSGATPPPSTRLPTFSVSAFLTPRSSSPSSRTDWTSRTVSENHLPLSPRSALEDTPPPSMIGTCGAATAPAGGAGTGPTLWQSPEVTQQLLAVMQAQQGLLAVLTRSSTPTRSADSTPEPVVIGQPRREAALASALQHLLERAQQQEAASPPAPPTSLSPCSTSPRDACTL